MSRTYSIICDETKQSLWVGQGSNIMTSFYSGDPDVMYRLAEFLRTHQDKEIKFVCADFHDDLVDYDEFMDPDPDDD